jgi:hypothetical protein
MARVNQQWVSDVQLRAAPTRQCTYDPDRKSLVLTIEAKHRIISRAVFTSPCRQCK